MSLSPAYLSHLFATTYNNAEWFVSFQKAVKGLTAEQAVEKINGENIFGIVAHLTYWNGRLLKKIKGIAQSDPMQIDNKQTFTDHEFKTWEELLSKAEEVFSGWSKHLETLSEKDKEHFTFIANTCTHNAYHIGQIVTLRKLQGSWNKEEGVK